MPTERKRMELGGKMGSPAHAASHGIDRLDSMYDDVDQGILPGDPADKPASLGENRHEFVCERLRI